MKKQIAEHLLHIEAVSLSPNEPFTWSSGLKSPISYVLGGRAMEIVYKQEELLNYMARAVKVKGRYGNEW